MPVLTYRPGMLRPGLGPFVVAEQESGTLFSVQTIIALALRKSYCSYTDD
jgi:hypothetical protein